MVNIRAPVILTSLISLCLFVAPVLAQGPGGGAAADGQCEVCKTVAASLQACPSEDMACLCSGDIIASSNACVSCVEEAAVDGSTIPSFDTIKGQPALCGSANSTSTTPTTAQTGSSTTATSTASAGTAPGSTVSAPPPERSNGAVALTGGAGALTAMAAFVLGFAL